MPLTGKLIDYILERQMPEAQIRSMLQVLSSDGQDEVMGKVATMLAKVAAMLRASKELSETLSVEIVLGRVLKVTTDVVNAERGTVFLYDEDTGELFSRVTEGALAHEIRFPNNIGIAGSVYNSGRAEIIDDPYADERFNVEIDRQTSFKTKNMLCAPLRDSKKAVIGVIQLLNKIDGEFSQDDLNVLTAVTSQVAAALKNAQLTEQMARALQKETELLELSSAISSELQLIPLLERIIDTTSSILNADRSTLFLYDRKTGELFSQVAQGLDIEIRLSSDAGLVGAAFTSKEVISVADAYADMRFNSDIDRRTGYRTRSVLCMPVLDKDGTPMGVLQVLNRNDGRPFDDEDQSSLAAFAGQASIAITNAMLFDEALNVKNYNESILESLTNGVITLDSNGQIEKCNSAALHILGEAPDMIHGMSAQSLFGSDNQWVIDSIASVKESGETRDTMDTEVTLRSGKVISVNLSAVPLRDIRQNLIGTMLVFEDISGAKRLQGTLARYLPKEVADKVMDSESLLGGQAQTATVLFSDIRSFTSISEEIGAQETVSMLNEYFTLMVDIVLAYQGVLDKYIGDALVAVFGTPFSTGQDDDHAVQAAIDMLRTLTTLNEGRKRDGKHELSVGIGINTGDVLAGNIGSLKRMDYTVMGVGVDLATKLEGVTKYYGTSLLISEFCLAKLTRTYRIRDVDALRLYGYEKPVLIYEVMDHFVSDDSADTWIEHHNDAVRRYRAREWEASLAIFERLSTDVPDDQLTKIYIQRCQQFIDDPPADNWDGVWTDRSA